MKDRFLVDKGKNIFDSINDIEIIKIQQNNGSVMAITWLGKTNYFLMNGIILKILYSRSQLDSKALFQLCQSLYQMGKQRGISANNALYRCLNS